MTHPLYNNPEAPARAPIVNDLFVGILSSAMEVESYKDIPHEVNAALGLCEIATALPPSWFCQKERVVIVGLIQHLYGDANKFLRDLMDGSVSFINTYGENHMDGKFRSLDQVVDEFHKAQENFLAGV